MGAGQAETVPQEIDEEHPRLGLAGAAAAVDGKRKRASRGHRPASALAIAAARARRVIAAVRWRLYSALA